MHTTPLQPVPGPEPATRHTPVRRTGFEDALDGARLSLSKHAATRLSRRALPLDAARVKRLEAGIDRAAARGAETSLVLLDELALLVKVPQRLVMTAMSQSAMRDGVVTRIDSAVVA
jgi:flagellar operon protein